MAIAFKKYTVVVSVVVLILLSTVGYTQQYRLVDRDSHANLPQNGLA